MESVYLNIIRFFQSSYEFLYLFSFLVASFLLLGGLDDLAIDLYYWYWGTLAMSQLGGARWDQWRAHLVRALPGHQRREPGRDERQGIERLAQQERGGDDREERLQQLHLTHGRDAALREAMLQTGGALV